MSNLLSSFSRNTYSIITRFLSCAYARHLLLTTALFMLAFFLQEVTYHYGEQKDEFKMTRLLKYAAIFPDTINQIKEDSRSVLVKKKISDTHAYVTIDLPTVVNCKVERIHQQLTDVILRANNHLTVAREFMIQSFVCTSTSAIFFIISAMALAFITKAGLANANPLLHHRIYMLDCDWLVFYPAYVNLQARPE